MRKLREAALVATMVGSVSMLGAGVASAGGWEPPQEDPSITCVQANGDTVEAGEADLSGLVTLTGGGGDADSRAQQNNCGVDITENVNTSGDATGGAATGLL